MEKVEVEVLSAVSNAVVIQTPGRRFPGMVIQGDSLRILLGHAQEICDLSKKGNVEELSGAAEDLRDLLKNYVEVYERTLREHGRELPW